jgi:hypothetical protein
MRNCQCIDKASLIRIKASRIEIPLGESFVTYWICEHNNLYIHKRIRGVGDYRYYRFNRWAKKKFFKEHPDLHDQYEWYKGNKPTNSNGVRVVFDATAGVGIRTNALDSYNKWKIGDPPLKPPKVMTGQFYILTRKDFEEARKGDYHVARPNTESGSEPSIYPDLR